MWVIALLSGRCVSDEAVLTFEECTNLAFIIHNSDVKMRAIAPQITGVSIVYSNACLCADQRKHQSSASLAFVRGIQRSPVNSPLKGPVTRKLFPFDDVIMGIPGYQLDTTWEFGVTVAELMFFCHSCNWSIAHMYTHNCILDDILFKLLEKFLMRLP